MVALTVSGGDICPIWPPLATAVAAQPFTTLSTSRLGTRCATVLIVVALESTPLIRPRESTCATSIQPGKKVLLNATESAPRRRRMMEGVGPGPGAMSGKAALSLPSFDDEGSCS